MERRINETRARLKDLPEDDSHYKGFVMRIDTVAAEFTKLALADRVKDVAATIQRKYDLYKDDWDGYEKETTGPTWAEYKKQQSDKMSAFYSPRTRVYVMRMSELLSGLADNDDYKSVQADPTIKALVAGIQAKRDAAAAKLVKIVTPMVDAALADTVKDQGDFDRLESDVRLALGENSPEGLAMRDKLHGKIAAHEAATVGAEKAKTELAAKLRAKAEEVWPKLYEGINYTTEIDLTEPSKMAGKNIGFLADNLMGYRFKPGDFYFATTLGGVPVAGVIDPQLKKQIDATEKAIGRSLGDDDSDGKWDCIAIVTTKRVKLMAKRQAEATGTVDGANVKLTADYAEPVDAVVINIIAAKCGPFAGVKDRGVVTETGDVKK
jgi:hypothetical protein